MRKRKLKTAQALKLVEVLSKQKRLDIAETSRASNTLQDQIATIRSNIKTSQASASAPSDFLALAKFQAFSQDAIISLNNYNAQSRAKLAIQEQEMKNLLALKKMIQKLKDQDKSYPPK